MVVLNRPVCIFAGEIDPSNFCPFCKLLFKRVPVHIRNIHSRSEKRVLEIEKLKDKAMRAKAYEQLLREGNFFANNAKAITTGRGFIIPTRKSDIFKDHKMMLHCTKCYMLMERYNYDRHQDTCSQKVIGEPKNSLFDEKLGQVNM